MNSPPESPPLVFRYDNKKIGKIVARNIPVILVFGINLILLPIEIFLHTSVIVSVVCIVISTPILFAMLMVVPKNWGRRIEIRGGRIYDISRSGSIRMEGAIIDIVSLIPSKYKVENGLPNSYYVRFHGKKDLDFDPDIENMELLLQTLELRTGKTFKR